MSGPPSAPNSPIARICMTDRDVVARAALLLERAVTSVPARQPHYKPPYITQVKGHDAVGLMRAVRPALGPDRQQQIDRALESWAPPRSRRRRAPNPFTSLEAFKFVADDDRATSWLAGRLEGEGTPSLPRVTPNSAATRLFLFRCATRPWCSGQRESLKDRRSPCESPNEEIGGQRMWRRWVAGTPQSGCGRCVASWASDANLPSTPLWPSTIPSISSIHPIRASFPAAASRTEGAACVTSTT